MDTQKIFSNIINPDNTNSNTGYSTMAVEKLVMIMLESYITKQGKKFYSEYSNNQNPCRESVLYDGYAPDGFDDYAGSTAIDIKIFRSSRFSKNLFYETVKKIAKCGCEIQNLILIVIATNIRITDQMIYEIQRDVHFNVYLWKVSDLEKIFQSNRSLLEEAYFNINTLLLRDTISKSIDRGKSTYIDKRKKYIEQLNCEYDADRIVLFLGAGASRDANIATWDTLISELFVALIDKELTKSGIKIGINEKKKIVNKIITQNGNSPLLQTRFLRNGLDDEFQDVISEVLYRDSKSTSDLLEEIGQLCIPNRGKVGIQAIVNYNFDDLIEINLRRLRVKYFSIYGAGMVPNNDEIGIYHVHGFLPRDKDNYENLSNSLLVFSEEGYHKLLLEPYHWANMSQLNFFVNNTCLFIGLSMTDPNLRRLLEIAAQKRPDGDNECKHYAILPRLNIESSESIKGIKSFQNANETLQESFFKELGINVLWVDDYAEIPNILKAIKN